MLYTITGATGNIGKRIAEKLLQAGQEVRVVGRDASRLKPLTDRGAKPFVGALEDPAFLTQTFRDAKGAFVMIPPHLTTDDVSQYMDQVGSALVSALRQAKVPYVVNLSSVGADLPAKTGPILGLRRQEMRLNELKESHVLHLRPTYFMENFLANIPIIRNMGINGSSLRGDLSLAMIATSDIADAASEALLKLNFSGKTVRELLGPADVTLVDATKILGRAIGRPDLPYVQFASEDSEKGMLQAGISPSVARSYVELERALNDGILRRERTPENTTPTRLEQFAPIFAAAYKA